MPLFDPCAEIPGYAEAVEKQNFNRDRAFLGVPEILCGLQVSPLTFRHLLWLQVIGSPFIGASRPDAETLNLCMAGFFKTIAPLAKPSFMLTDFDTATHEELKKFMALAGKMNAHGDCLKSIFEFVEDAFMDAPASDGGAEGESYFSAGAALTHRLAKNYPALNPNPTVYPAACDVPLKAGFQLLKLIMRDDYAAAGKKPVLFNALTSSLKSRWLDTQQPERN